MLLLIFFLAGCVVTAPVCIKNGRPYCRAKGTFTYEWYDYYERALSCIEGGCYEYALADLDTAISVRPDDRRMAKTYGMHFMDYFPHREKGLIHYLRGDYDRAREELETSVGYEPSDKAFLYLDRVRTEILRRDEFYVTTPRIRITIPVYDGEIHTRDDPIRISGVAEDRQYVSEISIGDRPFFIESSGQRVPFHSTLKLDEGRHEIDITARNLLSGASIRQLAIRVDRSGPVIILGTPKQDGRIQGHLYDASGKITLTADGQPVAVPDGPDVGFALPFRAGTKEIILLATDRLGNRTRAVIPLPLLARKDHPLMALNARSTLAYDGHAPTAALFARADTPDIRIEKPADRETVFSEMIAVRGRVSSPATIESVSVNNTDIYGKSGSMLFFNHPVRLKPGTNRIVVRATDGRGGDCIRMLTIIREIPEVLKPRYRCMFKAAPFDTYADENGQAHSAFRFQGIFLKELIARKRFRVRLKEDLQKTFPDPAPVLRTSTSEKPAAPFVPSRLLLSGYVRKTVHGTEIVSKITDIRTGQRLAVPDVYIASDSAVTLEAAAAELSEKFHRAFPLIRGQVILKKGKKFLIHAEEAPEITEWPWVIGSDREFAGDARIVRSLRSRNYWAEWSNHKHRECSTGDWAVTE
ncbi:hypothetical protein [Desulfonema ishimotonii]|uniref:hypothetical protein n=1 Tax=Desulfonema ishimotonii TaxID=45657 RepID=UPI0014098A05|nr:hypothetical protein [Desulfonema ishimotonii]